MRSLHAVASGSGGDAAEKGALNNNSALSSPFRQRKWSCPHETTAGMGELLDVSFCRVAKVEHDIETEVNGKPPE